MKLLELLGLKAQRAHFFTAEALGAGGGGRRGESWENKKKTALEGRLLVV